MNDTKCPTIREQINSLANFIMSEVDGEPSQNEGAVECAIRIIQEQKETIEVLKEQATKLVDETGRQAEEIEQLKEKAPEAQTDNSEGSGDSSN